MTEFLIYFTARSRERERETRAHLRSVAHAHDCGSPCGQDPARARLPLWFRARLNFKDPSESALLSDSRCTELLPSAVSADRLELLYVK